MKNYDTIEMVEKGIDEIEVVEKFNPFHDELGRFATSQGFKTYSADPKTKAGAMAIGRSYAAGHTKTINSHANSKNSSIQQNMWWVGDNWDAALASGKKYQDQKAKLKQKQKEQKEKQKQKEKPKEQKEKEKEKKLLPQKQKTTEPQEDPNNNTTKQQKHRPETHLTGEDAAKVVMKDTGVDKNTAMKMVDSVRAFSGSSYEDIRSYQEHGHPPSAKAKADAIEDFITRSPKWDGGDIYRGISVDQTTAKNIVAGVKKGKAISMMGMSSWSSKKSVAENNFAYANNSWDSDSVSIIFKCSGAKQGTSIRHLSKFTFEDEVLVSSKSRWKGTKVTEKKNGSHTIYEIECEEI